MTAPPAPAPAPPSIVPFTATREQKCTSGADCDGVQVGQKAAYVGWSTGSGPVCGPCLVVIRGNIAAATDEAPVVDDPAVGSDGPMPSDPFLPEGNPAPQITDGDALKHLAEAVSEIGAPIDDGWLDDGVRRYLAGRGFILRGDDASWSLTDAGRAALGEHFGMETPEPSAPALSEGDDPAEDPAVSEAVAENVHECECKRVSSKAKFGRTSDERYTHEHCGGVLTKPKHIALAHAAHIAGNVPGAPQTTESTTETEQESEARDDGDGDAGEPDGAPAGTDPGAGAGAGVEAGPADGAAGAGEGGGEGDGGAGEGDHRGDQGGDASARVRRGDHPEPVRGEAVEAGAGGVVEVRLDGAQEVRPGDVGEVGEEVDRLALRRDGLTGLAAFYAQPDDGNDDPAPGAGSPAASTDTAPATPLPTSADRSGNPPAGPVGALAAFYAQPDEDDSAIQWKPDGAVEIARWERLPTTDPEALIRFVLHELGVRNGGEVTALVVRIEGEQYPRVVSL